MIGFNVNNSISHPPHPRRAVPANLPPGAFFYFLFGVFRKLVLLFFLCSFPVWASGDTDLSQKIADLRLKSNAHGRFVQELLANEVILEKIEPEKKVSIENKPLAQLDDSSSLPTIKLPESFVNEKFVSNEPVENKINENSSATESKNVKIDPVEADNANQTSLIDERSSVTDSQESSTYKELYAPKIPQRREGYYFGPFLGGVFPDDSAVRQSSGKTAYNSSVGITGGLRVGKDFGYARIEGEYGIFTHNVDSAIGSGRVNFHNLQSRLILEKNLGDRADIRAGLGLGLGFIGVKLGEKKFDGVSFSYDFLLGWSYRVMNNWSIHVDYRHYLTAAHENYDRLQGHAVEFSACFDL